MTAATAGLREGRALKRQRASINQLETEETRVIVKGITGG
jgi:hypothetical protein